MAGLMDICSLILTSAFFIGVILGTALVAQKCQALIDATKASLEERGWVVSGAHRPGSPSSASESLRSREDERSSVVVVNTKKMMDHERYLDATQRGVIKALNACTFGAPSSQTQTQNQTTTTASNASASNVPASGPSSAPSFGLSSTFAHIRSQLLLPQLAPRPEPQSDRLESSSSGGKQGPAAVGRGVVGPTTVGGRLLGGQAKVTTSSGTGTSGRGASISATSDGDSSQSRGGGDGTARDSFYEMADKLSAWPSEKIEKVKRLRDQFLSKV